MKKMTDAEKIAKLRSSLERMVNLLDLLYPCIPWGKTWDTAKWLSELNEAPLEARDVLEKIK